MPQSILVFDFGTNEDAAQQARHKVEAWKQGFRLGDKMLLKFEREENAAETPASAEASSDEAAEPEKPAAVKSGKKKSAAKSAAKSGAKTNKKAGADAAAEPEQAETPTAPKGKVRLMLRLNFSDHEKLSHQRWLDRIPAEEPFKSASGETIRPGDPEFPKTLEAFDSLD